MMLLPCDRAPRNALPSIFVAVLAFPSCSQIARSYAPDDRLWFPEAPLYADATGTKRYDTDGDGRADFEVLPNRDGVIDRLRYDDDHDGVFDREVRPADHAAEDVPHVVFLMDSLPLRLVRPRWDRGDLRWSQPPQHVIPPFPSMSVVTFSEILHAKPMPGAAERYLDVDRNEVVNDYVGQALGDQLDWHTLLDWYLRDYAAVGASYIEPEVWLESELFECAEVSLRAKPGDLVITYVCSSSGMASALGAAGLERSLDLLEQLCLQLLYETEGAIRISVVSDHGHTLITSKRFDPEAVLEEAGFDSCDRGIDYDREVFVELDGLVSYFGVQTGRPAEVAQVLVARPELEFVCYSEGDAVIVRSATGCARIEKHGDALRYVEIDGDVLGYRDVIADLRARGRLDDDGFASDRDWFDATLTHEYPDGLARLVAAFGKQVQFPCRVMCALKPQHHAGLEAAEWLVTMASTHGGLSAIHSDAVLLTMHPGVHGPLRSRDVLRIIEPRYDPAKRRVDSPQH